MVVTWCQYLMAASLSLMISLGSGLGMKRVAGQELIANPDEQSVQPAPRVGDADQVITDSVPDAPLSNIGEKEKENGARNEAASGPELNSQSGDRNSDTEPWLGTLDQAVEQATEQNKPIFAVVSASWCVFCEKLEDEMTTESVLELSKSWVLVRIDADDRAGDARELSAVALPSLRLLSKDGLIGQAHDGYLPHDQLLSWLETHRELVQRNVPGILEIDPEVYSQEQIDQLLQVIAIRDVTLRRIVLKRLSKIPERCAYQVIECLQTGRLAEQLSAIELLRGWEAPVEGLDPWKPGAIDGGMLESLRQWCEEAYPKALDAA